MFYQQGDKTEDQAVADCIEKYHKIYPSAEDLGEIERAASQITVQGARLPQRMLTVMGR